MKKQIIIIHGGDSYHSYGEFLDRLKDWDVTKESFFPKRDWKSNLLANLGENFELLAPRMPNKQNAHYDEWKVWFEKMIPFVDDNTILIGYSMGGMFLVKYLAEQKFPKKIKAIFLIAATYNETEDIGDFRIAEDLQNVWAQCQNIHIFQSTDDPIVPASEAQAYQKIWPGAEMHIFQDRGHFTQDDFPELIKEIQKIAA